MQGSSRSSPSVDGDEHPWETPVLITGCPRTGTSALAHALSSHPRICIFNEYSLYTAPVVERSLRQRLLEMPDDNDPPPKIGFDAITMKARVAAELSADVSMGDIRSWLFGFLQERQVAYGDKMPFVYLQNMASLAERFPGVRFLVTVRDGRAVIASQIREYRKAVAAGREPANWMQPTVAEAEALWLRSVRKWIPLREAPPAPCLEVRYEHATLDPEGIAQRIASFLGFEYENREFQAFLERYRSVHVDLWREELPHIDAQLSEEFRDALDTLGYG